jgi:hypothetical protein
MMDLGEETKHLVATHGEKTKGDCSHKLCDTDRTHHLDEMVGCRRRGEKIQQSLVVGP